MYILSSLVVTTRKSTILFTVSGVGIYPTYIYYFKEKKNRHLGKYRVFIKTLLAMTERYHLWVGPPTKLVRRAVFSCQAEIGGAAVFKFLEGWTCENCIVFSQSTVIKKFYKTKTHMFVIYFVVFFLVWKN